MSKVQAETIRLLRREIREYRSVLAFYARHSTYQPRQRSGYRRAPAIEDDRGQRARKAIGQ